MANKINLKDLAPIVIPHGPPVQSTAEYHKSLNECAKMVKRYQAWDVARPTPYILLEQARSELMDVEEKMAEKREQQTAHRQVMAVKWRDLREKELQLRESFISFNRFIRENKDKRDRAESKIAADLEALARKANDTIYMENRLREMQEVKELMEKQVEDYAIYEEYLMSVVQMNPEFKQPLDILNRYEALAAARSTLAERQEHDLEMLESARQEIASLTEEKKLFMMGLNNTLASLRYQYNKISNNVLKWELALNRLKETAAKREMELGHVRAAIWAFYVKICKNKGLTIDVKFDDFEQQLVIVMRGLLELKRIYSIALKKTKTKEAEEASRR